MTEKLFFYLGIVNNLFLIFIFLLRRATSLATLQRVGTVYMLLALPALVGIYLAAREHASARYIIFLGIFLAYLALEGLFDLVLKLPFRENWKLLTPYLCFYYAMNYGFIVMPWKTAPRQGGLMLGLFVLQIAANLSSHSIQPT